MNKWLLVFVAFVLTCVTYFVLCMIEYAVEVIKRGKSKDE